MKITKTYICKNFKYPYIQINNYKKTEQYTINFLNKNQIPIKNKKYKNKIPQALIKLFNLKPNQTNKGLLTEITCIKSITQ